MEASAATLEFIAAHRHDDVRELALHARREPGLDLPFALDQIAGRAVAERKLPQWAAHEGIIYPPHLAMEQCSSQTTADYKACLVRRLLARHAEQASGTLLVDLTGGFGVDFTAMAPAFDRATYVERQETLCTIARHNFDALGLNHVQVEHADAIDHLDRMARDDQSATLIYLDPARRDSHGARTYAIADCTPDVLELKNQLLGRAPLVIVKLSPMLDWRKTIEDFTGSASELHIVSSSRECKEILVVLDRGTHTQPQVYCVEDSQCLSFTAGSDQRPSLLPAGTLEDMRYLYEPNMSIMKAGAFAALQQHTPVPLWQVGANSHLFASRDPVPMFPGRAFRIEAVGTMNKRELRALLDGVTHANIAVRNFPLTAPQLRKKLKLKDGGQCYLFATTVHGRHVLLRTCKIRTI